MGRRVRRGGGCSPALGGRGGRAAAPPRQEAARTPARACATGRRPGIPRRGRRNLDRRRRRAHALAAGLGPLFRWIGDHVPRWLDWPAEGPGRRLLPVARRLLARLDIGATTLVHGDLHHHNLLSSGSGYVAIDPKPMLGEPEYDIAPFLLEPDRLQDAPRRHRTEAGGLCVSRARRFGVCVPGRSYEPRTSARTRTR